jgi:transposase
MGKRGKCISVHLRQLIILKFLAGRKPISLIARQCHVNRSVVRRWIKVFKSQQPLQRKRGQGRKPELTRAACARALELLAADHLSARAAATTLFNEGFTSHVVCGHTVTKHTQMYAKQIGTPITCKFSKMRRRLTETNQEQRLAFCRLHRNSDFKRVMFIDRCKFYFQHPGEAVQSGMYRFVAKQREAFSPTHPPALNVYGGITPHGTTPLFIVTGTTKYRPTPSYTTKTGSHAKNITSKEYFDVLLHGLLPAGHELFKGEDWVLQQDNDPTHKQASEKAVKDWNASLKKKHIHGGRVQIMKDWPPNSPDLSIIENCWAITKGRVLKRKCDTFEEFSEAVKDIFANMQPTPLYTSIPKRIKQCIQVQGDRTHH